MDKGDLLKRADDLLRFIIDGLEAGRDLAEREAPLLVHEVIRWGIVSNAMAAGIAAIVLALSIWAARWCQREEMEELIVVSAVFTLGSAIAFVVGVIMAVQDAVAPRLYLLGQLKQLLK